MKDIREVHDLVREKRCIIVGPSPSLVGENLGDWIDQFDIVIRLNNYFKNLEKIKMDYGSKTDLIYHCFGIGNEKDQPNPNEWKNLNVIFCSKKQNQKRKIKTFLEKFPEHTDSFSVIEKEFVDTIYEKSQLHLHTGVVAIFHLLTMPLKELHAVGFSFYRDSYNQEFGKWSVEETLEHSKKCGHDLEQELQFFLQEISQYRHFYPHGILKKLIQGEIK